MYYEISEWSKGIINAGFAAVILWIYFGMFLKEKRYRRRYLCWIPFLGWHFLWIWMTLSQWHFPFIINTLINFSCVVALAVGAYEGKLKTKLAFAAAYVGIDVLAEVLVWFVLSAFYLPEEMEQMWWGSVASRSVMVVVITVLHHFFKRRKLVEINERYNVYLLFVPLGSIFVVHSIFRAYEKQGGGVELLYAVMSGMVMLSVNALVYLIYYDTWNIFELKRKNEAFEYQLKLSSQHQKEQEERFAEIRRMRHDYRKNLLYLRELAQAGRTEEILRMVGERLADADRESSEIIRTGNAAVDALVNDKYRSAAKAGVRFLTDICIPAELPVGGTDLCIVLGNLLDNALEAVVRSGEKDGYLSVFICYDRNNLVICVENSYDGTVRVGSDGRYLTRKRNDGSHGLGIDSVSRVVEKYHGMMEVDSEGPKFRTRVLLYGNTE